MLHTWRTNYTWEQTRVNAKTSAAGVVLALGARRTHTTRTPYKPEFLRRKTVARGFGKWLQADLVDISNVSKANKVVRFLLTAGNVVSGKRILRHYQTKPAIVLRKVKCYSCKQKKKVSQ